MSNRQQAELRPAQAAQARAIVNALGAGWALENASPTPAEWQSWEAVRLADGLRVGFDWPETWGRKSARLVISGIWPSSGPNGMREIVRTPYGEADAVTSITVDPSKPAETIARDILRRLVLPSNGFEPVWRQARERIMRAELAAAAQAQTVQAILAAEPGARTSPNTGPGVIYLGNGSHGYTVRVDSDTSVRFEPFSVDLPIALRILTALRKPAPALVHLFSAGRYAVALCGMGNGEDGDAPATEDFGDVTCEACKAKYQATHAEHDPHCTCNDCIQSHADRLES